MTSDLEVTVHTTIDEVNRNQWNNLVGQSEHGTVFHRYEWLAIVERELDREPVHVVVYKRGNPVALLPNFVDEIDPGEFTGVLDAVLERLPLRRIVSTEPGYGGPVVTTDTEACLDLLFEGLDGRRDGRTVFQTIKMYDTGGVRYAKYLAKRGYTPELLSCRFVVDLGADWGRIEREMHKTRRHALRSGLENDVEVTQRSLADVDVDETYEAYRKNMRRVDGDRFPRSLFRSLADHMPDRAVAFTASVDGEVVGRFVHLVNEEQSSLVYYASAIGDEANFEYHPSELLHAEAMRWSMDNGYRTYDFGATGADFTDGLFRYKEKFGGRLVPVVHWRRGTSTVLWAGFRAGERLYQRYAY